MDYGIWSILVKQVYKPGVNIRDKDHLKELIIAGWEAVTQEVVNKTIDHWKTRL